jgi:tellurite methyltransferase
MSKPFWEKTYQDDAVSTFSKGPTADVAEFWTIFPAGASILDVGCGEGRNAIFLAENGFDVDAFDISESGVEKAKRIAASRNVRVNFWQQDLIQYNFEKNYDIILSHGVLHLVTKTEWGRFIAEAKIHTNSDGLNIIGIFTNRLPATADNAPFTKGLFDVGELPALYTNWELVHHLEGTFEDEHPGSIHHEHAYERIIARKS